MYLGCVISRLLDGSRNGTQEDNKKKYKNRTRRQELVLRETWSTGIPKIGDELELFNNDQSSTYIGLVGSRMITTWHLYMNAIGTTQSRIEVEI